MKDQYEVMDDLILWMYESKVCQDSLVRATNWRAKGWGVHDLWESKDPQDIYLKFCFLVREEICTYEVVEVLELAIAETLELQKKPGSLLEWQNLLRNVTGYWHRQLVEQMVYTLHSDEDSEKAVSTVLFCLEHVRGEDYLLELDERLQCVVEWDELFAQTVALVGKE